MEHQNLNVAEYIVTGDRSAVGETLQQIKHYLEHVIPLLQAQLESKQCNIDTLKTILGNAQVQEEKNKEQVNALLSELRKLQQYSSLYKRVH